MRRFTWPPIGLGGDGAMLVGSRPGKDLPPIARHFRRLLGQKGWTVVRLHEEAVKRFGDDASVPTSFRRLVTKSAPSSDSKTVRQAEALLGEEFEPVPVDDGEAKTTIEQIAGDEPVVSIIAPLIGHIPAAADADEQTIVEHSRRLMNSRHASLHALLTLLLAAHK